MLPELIHIYSKVEFPTNMLVINAASFPIVHIDMPFFLSHMQIPPSLNDVILVHINGVLCSALTVIAQYLDQPGSSAQG